MRKNSVFDLNYLWLFFVLIHICGSYTVMILTDIPFGSILAITAATWMMYLYFKDCQYPILYAGILLSVLLFLNNLMSVSVGYVMSYLLNLIQLTFVFYFLKKDKLKFLTYMRIRLPDWKQIVCMVCLTISTLIVAMYINNISLLFTENRVAEAVKDLATYDVKAKVAAILILALIPAFVEEVIFRGVLYRATSEKKKAIVLTAICFALLHLNLNQISYALFMGIVLALIIFLTDNLTLSIFMHVCFNLYTVIMNMFIEYKPVQKIIGIHWHGYYPFNPSVNRANMNETLIYGLIIASIAFVISAILFILLNRISRHEETVIDMKETNNPWKPDVSFAGATIICLVMTFHLLDKFLALVFH